MMRGIEPTFNFELGIVNKNSMSSNNDTADANCNEITAILFFPQGRDLLRLFWHLFFAVVKVPFNGKARGQWPKNHIHLIGLNFRGFIFCSLKLSLFLDSVLLLGFLTKLNGFLASNLKLI